MKLTLASVFAVFLGYFVALSLAETVAMDKQAIDACIKESSSLTPDEIKRINENKIMSKDQPSASGNLHCYLLCYYKKLGLIGTDGKRKPEALIEYMGRFVKDKSKVLETLQKCVSTSTSNKCESVYNFEKCVHDMNN